MNKTEEFYIGYQPRAPRNLANFIRRITAGIVVAAVLIALALVFGQNRFASSFFDFGNVREFEGIVWTAPFPALQVPDATGAAVQYALVAEGKHGADSLVAGMDGKRVKLRGTEIRRDGMTMIEVVRGSVREVLQAATANAALSEELAEELGIHTLIGEIVDSKCYLGVMNPGHTKPHRECAVRCISGGVPPLFVVRDAAGKTLRLWLVDVDGSPVNQRVLDLVAEPVEISGAIARRGDQFVLRADPASYKRVY